MGTISKTIVTMGAMVLVAGVSAVATLHIGPLGQVKTERMLESSVSIKTISHVRTDRFGDSVWQPAFGSGFLVSDSPCQVWTNHHVIEDAAIIRVFPRGEHVGTGIPARVLHATPQPDIAVLQLDSCDGIRVAALGDSTDVMAGMEVYAVGNPLGRNPDSISRGIISHTARASGTSIYLQTDANINRGNSGGALFDRRGKVIGMNVALASTKKGGHTGIGYAIPVNQVAAAVERLRAHAPGWGTGGIDEIASNLTAAEAAAFRVPKGLRAVILTDTPEDGPGAGLLQERDVIYRVGGTPVNDVQHLRRLFAEREPGAEIPLDLVRSGEPLSVALTLGDGFEESEAPVPQPYEGLLGMTLEMWSDREGEEGQFANPVITQVQGLGPAHLAEISSSQHSMAFNGRAMVEYLLDVKTITGMVVDGKYHSVSDLESVHGLAAEAHARNVPLLLEIEQWARENPRNARTKLVHRRTAFFKVDPAPGATSIELADDEPGLEAVSVKFRPRMHPGDRPV